MGNKDKGGRETRKPKASKKAKGVVVPPTQIIPPKPASNDSK
ncbi:MAG TPA: hypothetical protein VHC43_13855 [Mycobacteriales bacterium]|nr:hypothetical protein [Mycobacteriales bacterium]